MKVESSVLTTESGCVLVSPEEADRCAVCNEGPFQIEVVAWYPDSDPAGSRIVCCDECAEYVLVLAERLGAVKVLVSGFYVD